LPHLYTICGALAITEVPGWTIRDATISGVLLASHRLKITGSFRWSALHSSEIDRLITSQMAEASSGMASRILHLDSLDKDIRIKAQLGEQM
jgi:hypothetical protein